MSDTHSFDELVDLTVAAVQRQLGPDGISIFPAGSVHDGRKAFLINEKFMMFVVWHKDDTYEFSYAANHRDVMSVKSTTLRDCAYAVCSYLLNYKPLSYTLELKEE